MIKKVESYEQGSHLVELLTDGKDWAVITNGRFRLFNTPEGAVDALEQEIMAIKGICMGKLEECLNCTQCEGRDEK